MARRSVLHGASDWEREEKANQQRDYAAQLQEQIRLKNAKAEEEKARKLQEQQAERELMDRERNAQRPQRQPQLQLSQDQINQQQQSQNQRSFPSPEKSPQKAASIPQTEAEMYHSSTNNLSPSKNSQMNNQFPSTHNLHDIQTHSFYANYYNNNNTSAPSHHYPFSSDPSIFESILQEYSSGVRQAKFNEDFHALQQLRTESNHVKPNFILQPEPIAVAKFALPTKASLSASVSLEDKDLLELSEDATPRSRERLTDASELHENSVLIPLPNISKPHTKRSPSPVKKDVPQAALYGDSELVHFSDWH